ncbi:MAG TPA: tRNA (adenosine(37)-N6)-dimethylallyltransferase MiaA [Bacilli bacterium]|nr:tRNA (adenosine(37)-N6)-dimethylallyltransferase MiaA [Bacilli bacterium]
MNKIIVIVGPTGVGKTKLSIELAKKYDGEIINADSTQVYKDLNIGTAKVTEEEKEGIKHHLLSFISPNDLYTVYDYQIDGRKAIDDILKRNKTVIIVGGSGLYVKVLLYDYNFKEEDKRISYEMYTIEDLYNKLKEIDPNTDISKNNRQRIERALTFYSENGFPISMKDGRDKLLYDCKIIGLTADRDKLYNRIRRKTEIMFENGLLKEVKELYDNGINGQIVHTAIGYKELYDYFDKKISLEEAISIIKSNSTSYAKRQFTWFNNQMNVKWFNVDFDNFDKTIESVKEYLKEE